MYRIFFYIDRFYTKNKSKITIAKGAMNLYSSIYFEEVKHNIFTEVNKLIREERSNNTRESRTKIKSAEKQSSNK